MATETETRTGTGETSFGTATSDSEYDRRPGTSSKLPLILFALVVFIGLGGIVVWAVMQAFGSDEADVKGVLTYTVERRPMRITVADDGNVESASNVDIKCQVAGGGVILWIVEDGKRVEEGELLVQLDTSALEDQLQQQRILHAQAQATKIQSEEAYEAAKIAVREFDEGTYLQQLQLAESDIQIATEALKSSENVLEFTEKMVRKGFATPLQLEADRSALQQARFNLEAAETAKRVLEDFTYEKTMKELEAARDAAEAQLTSDQASLELETTKLSRLEEQIANSMIYAPQSGMVVYANENSRRRSSSEAEIAEGATVREGQTILKLPDLMNMQVKMTVHESKVDQIEPGMPARITILGQSLGGHVVSIANQPEPGSWFSANVKEYATTVAIEGQTSGLRPGMTASVVVLIEEIPDAVTVPVSAVVQKRGKFYCYLRTAGEPEEREVIVGRSNEAYVQIIDGVKEGDVVLRNPRAVVPDARDDTPLEERSAEQSEFGERVEMPPAQNAPRGAPGDGGAGGGRGNFVSRFMQNDADGDGKISRDEVPERARSYVDFDTLDKDGDGLLDRSELSAGMQQRGSGPGGRAPGAGGPPGGAGRGESPSSDGDGA
jgi:multidrug efflux pump subunit AcrA (membrane-fusion protein)